MACGPTLAGRGTVALDMVPDKDFVELVGRIRGEADSGVIQDRLRKATDLRVTLTVDAELFGVQVGGAGVCRS